MNLGRSSRTPGAYHIWVPSEHRIVTTSEVYFSETNFPWRAITASPEPAPAQPSCGDSAQPPGLPPGPSESSASAADSPLPVVKEGPLPAH
eukprot:3131892-Pleurochrysis_carterae.AAC.1